MGAGTKRSRGSSRMARRMRRSVTSLVRTWLSTMFRRCVAASTIVPLSIWLMRAGVE